MAILPANAVDIGAVPGVEKTPARPVAARPATEVKAPADTGREAVSREELMKAADAMNGFMQAINTDIKFSIHEKTKQIIVQVIDAKDQTVLKEFPPHELLDTIAAIRDYVGVLLDKKA